MATGEVINKPADVRNEDTEDQDLQQELKSLVDKVTGGDGKIIQSSLEMLKYLLRTSTASMTSVPKPLKYLQPYYRLLKETYDTIPGGLIKRSLADLISVLSIGGGEEIRTKHDCLFYCVKGTMENISDWGHEYIRRLEWDIVEMFDDFENKKLMLYLIKEVLIFDFNNHAEIEACDLLMEIQLIFMLAVHIQPSNCLRVCLYLDSCSRYVSADERNVIKRFICQQYIEAKEFVRAAVISMQLRDSQLLDKIFHATTKKLSIYQMAYISGRQLMMPTSFDDLESIFDDDDLLLSLFNNTYRTTLFTELGRELDILEPKLPEEVYKAWLEPTPVRLVIVTGEKLDSALQNLAASLVNGFVNCAFGTEKLISKEQDGTKWIYRHKEYGMMTATASYGLVYLWDVDGGLTPIDKYFYSSNNFVKAGALLAVGIINCRVNDVCEPAIALLSNYVKDSSEVLQIGAILGLGLAYIGTAREDILESLLPLIDNCKNLELLGVLSVASGLISLGESTTSVAAVLLDCVIGLAQDKEVLLSPYMLWVVLGAAFCYYGTEHEVDAAVCAAEVLAEPLKTITQCALKMCAYAGSGDVLVVQYFTDGILCNQKARSESPSYDRKNASEEGTNGGEKEKLGGKKGEPAGLKKGKNKLVWNHEIGPAMATIGLAVVSKGEEIGEEMIQRILTSVGRYCEPWVKKAVPLAVAFCWASCPRPDVVEVLTRYAHDTEEEVACAAAAALGLVGAGTNNARVAQTLRHLAAYHARNPSQLFMVRLAQGWLHAGRGAVNVAPRHCDGLLVDPVTVAGLLVTIVTLLQPVDQVLSRSHYMLLSLAAAINPRWLLPVDELLKPITVSVRVGQAVDVVGKAGEPRTIAGIHTHQTPVLLASGERAELATPGEEHRLLTPFVEGLCFVEKKMEDEEEKTQ